MSRNDVFRALPIVAAHYGEKFGVKVVVGGSDAATDGNTILVPNVPESYPNKNVVWGCLVHEAGHVRSTAFDVWRTIAPHEAMRRHLTNVFEDTRIEHGMITRYPGVRSDLESTVTYMKKTGLFRMVSANDPPGAILQAKLLFWLRARFLRQPLEDLAEAAEQAMQETFSEGVNTRLAVLLHQATQTRSTADCLQLADKVLQMLQEEAEKEREQPQAALSSPQDDTGGGGADSDTDGDEDADSDAAGNTADGDADNVDDTGDDASQGRGHGPSAPDAVEPAGARIQAALESEDDDLAPDAFAALKQALCREADAHGNGTYCTVPTATPTHGNPTAGKALLDTVQRTTGRLKAQLMGLVQAARRDRDLAQRRGRRIDGRRVTRILAGDIRIFRKRADRVAANTAVHILTDLSGSMSGHREQVAREASLAIALGLETIPGVVPAVTYFGGYASDPVREAMGHGQSVRRNAHRFMQGTWGCTPMAEAVWFGAFQLSKRGEDRKILIVVTDGAPDDAKACHTVLALCRKAGIEAVGIGIGHDAVKAFFDRYIVISSVDELRSGLFQLMRERLIVEVA